jgi:hypothetical protein
MSRRSHGHVNADPCDLILLGLQGVHGQAPGIVPLWRVTFAEQDLTKDIGQACFRGSRSSCARAGEWQEPTRAEPGSLERIRPRHDDRPRLDRAYSKLS